MNQAGVLTEIVRYPVKSMGGETLAAADVDAGGLFGDRSHAFWNEARPGKFLSGLTAPRLVEYRAAFVGDVLATGYPAVEVTEPDGQVYRWGDERLNREIAEGAGLPLRPEVFPPGTIGANWGDHVLVTTGASLRALDGLWGGGPLDRRRFRSNFLVELEEERPFVEETWVGRRLQIGSVILQVNKPCLRCDVINIDPDLAVHDRSLLKTLAQHNNAMFGVYGSVVQIGTVQVGDHVRVL